MAKRLWKVKKAYREGKLFSALCSQMMLLLYGLRYLANGLGSNRIVLHCPDYVEPSKDKREMEIVERIFQAFRKMKEDQKKVSPCYLPSSIWQEQLDKSYCYLNSGLKENDIRKFHFFLANFGAWEMYHGVESSTLMRDNMRSFLRRNFLRNVVFSNQLKVWQWFYNNRIPLSRLTYPTYGNQVGAYIDNIFVGPGSFFNEIYGSLLQELISNIPRPVVADLGAGYGKLAYFTLRNSENFVFVDFDLPETLCLAAYYLMKVWPNKRVLLYGEENYSSDLQGRYDLIFMPSWEIGKVGDSSIDLFLNKNSLGEMTQESVTNYIHYITKATRYFFHMNHDIYPNIYSNKERGLLGYEYPIPMDQFKLLFRYPDVGYILHQGRMDFKADIFMYLYERKTENLTSPRTICEGES